VHTGMNDKEIVWSLNMYIPLVHCPLIDEFTNHLLVTEYDIIFVGINTFSSDSAKVKWRCLNLYIFEISQELAQVMLQINLCAAKSCFMLSRAVDGSFVYLF
jgi:hypothetical protein